VQFLLLGFAAVVWACFSPMTGKGHYRGCPPGGLDRAEDPLNFWAPTIIIFAIGIYMVLIFFGVIPLLSRSTQH
jgi:hypothetical protein